MASYETISSEVLGENNWWKYKHDRYVLPCGDQTDYYYGELEGNCILVPLLDDGRLMLVRQHRYLFAKACIEFPGGGIAKHETPSDAAVRELLEETGYQSGNLVKMGIFEPATGLMRDSAHVFLAEELQRVKDPDPEKCEEIELLYRRVDEFEDMIRRGEIWDGRTLAAWAIAREQILKMLVK